MNIWTGSDWHFWNIKNNNTHQYQTEQQIKNTIKLYADNIKEDDVFIFLGDLCDPTITDIPKLRSLITSIPGYKIICKGNHDIHDNNFYLDIGFDQVCEVCIYHNIIFSHKPIKVAPDEINVHGHLHSAKMSMLGYQNINAYVSNDKPVLLDTLLHDANVEQWDDKKDKWTNHTIEKLNQYLTLDNDNYTDIIYLESIFDSPIDEDISAMHLSSLSASIDDPINEILFPDIDSTRFWEADDNKYDEELTKAELNEMDDDDIEIDPLHGEVNRFFNRIQDYHESTIDEGSKHWTNDKGEPVPEVCPKCGTKVGIFLRGEPVYLCTNKKCGKYFGTVPFDMDESVNMKKFTKEFVKNHPGPEPFIGESDSLPDHVIELVDNVQFIDPVNETSQEDNKLYPVYVLIMHSGTPLSTAIKTITHSNFSHASISFDPSLKTMYSFGRKSDLNPIIAGFTEENINKPFFQNHPIPYALYVVFYHKDEIDKMKKRIQYFTKNKSKFKYDFIGLFKNYLGIADNPEYRWFCSRFVADIINAGTPTNSPYFKEPSLIRPEDFQYTSFARYVSGGYLNEYDEKYTIKQTKKLERVEQMKNDIDNGTIVESYDLATDNPYESSILNYQLSNMDEAAFSDFLSYVKSFKLRFDKQGNIIITRREYDQLEKHFHNSMKLMNAYEKADNYPGVKEELCKVQYLINLINKYYLTYKKENENKEIHKKMLDLRSVMLNVFQQKMKLITLHEPDFNFQTYYDKSKYGSNVVIPKKVITSIGKVILTAVT